MNEIMKELQQGDETFTYQEYLLQLCEEENKYYEFYSKYSKETEPNKTNQNQWPTKEQILKIYELSKKYQSSEITIHNTIFLYHYVLLKQPSIITEENPELLTYLCFSLSSKYYEKRIRWIETFFKDNVICCSQIDFKRKELKILSLLQYHINPILPLHYLHLFLDVYFKGNSSMKTFCILLSNLLFEISEQTLSIHSSFVCSLAIICCAQSLCEGCYSHFVFSWITSFVDNIDEIYSLYSVIMKHVLDNKYHSYFLL